MNVRKLGLRLRAWFSSRKTLLTELGDERAAIVAVECAVKPQCREMVSTLASEVERLASQNFALRTYVNDDLID